MDENSTNFTTNPYVLGLRGNWRPKASYVHLAGRTKAFANNNSNIREDGVFTSYTPFYELTGGNWNIDKRNWTYTSSVVEFSPFGQALETIDALDRYSSSMFGYNQSLPVAVAANSRYRQIGFDGFEDYNYINCSDDHFKIAENATIVEDESHTGRRSVQVVADTPVIFSNVFTQECAELECEFNIDVVNQGFVCSRICGDIGNHCTSTLTTVGAVQPVQFEYNMVYGDESELDVEITEDINGITSMVLTSHSQTPSSIIVTVTDGTGCSQETVISINDQNSVVDIDTLCNLTFAELQSTVELVPALTSVTIPTPNSPNSVTTTTDALLASQANFSVNNGAGPYTFNYTVNQGSPTVVTTSNSINFEYSNDALIDVDIQVTDANGCSNTTTLNSANQACELRMTSTVTEVNTYLPPSGFPFGTYDLVETKYEYQFLYGAPPYNITYNLNNGSPTIATSPNSISFTVPVGGVLDVVINVTDDNGCTKQVNLIH